jgi:hypothetical protein
MATPLTDCLMLAFGGAVTELTDTDRNESVTRAAPTSTSQP